MSMRRSISAGCLLAGLVTGAATGVSAQQPPAPSGTTPGDVVLNLGDPFTGLPCGSAYQAKWNLSLDQVSRFATSQLTACDLSLTLATIEGHVATAYDQVTAAEAENWNAWNAANGFLPSADDPAAEDRMVRVHTAQDRIQSARNGLRFLAKLSALLQFPPPPRPATPPQGQGVNALLGQAPAQPAPAQPSSPPGQVANQAYDPGAVNAAPLAPLPGDTSDLLDQPAQPAAPADTSLGASDETADDTRIQVACVTDTSWEVAARPSQNKDAMTIDDPVAGQALTWLANYAASADAPNRFHSFAACPGAVPSYATATRTPMPGAAQGIVTPPEPAAPPAPQPPGVTPSETSPDQRPADAYSSQPPSQSLPKGAPTGQLGGEDAPPGGQQD